MVILQKERSENSRSYAVRVLLYNIIHLELQPGTAVSENELSTTLSLYFYFLFISQKYHIIGNIE